MTLLPSITAILHAEYTHVKITPYEFLKHKNMNNTDNTDQLTQPSHRNFLIGIGAAIGLILVISLLAFVLFGSTKRESDKTSTSNTATTEHIVTKEDVQKNIENLDASIKQAKSDQDVVQAALNDKSQLKVSN